MLPPLGNSFQDLGSTHSISYVNKPLLSGVEGRENANKQAGLKSHKRILPNIRACSTEGKLADHTLEPGRLLGMHNLRCLRVILKGRFAVSETALFPHLSIMQQELFALLWFQEILTHKSFLCPNHLSSAPETGQGPQEGNRKGEGVFTMHWFNLSWVRCLLLQRLASLAGLCALHSVQEHICSTPPSPT